MNEMVRVMSTSRKGTRGSSRDVPKGLIWVDGIQGDTHNGWCLEGLCFVNRRITTSKFPFSVGLVAPLVDINSDLFLKSSTEMLFISVPDLASAEVVYDPGDLVRPLAHGIRPSLRHSLYKVQDEPPVYIPALLIIRALFTGNKILDQLLMIENGIDYLKVEIPQEADSDEGPGSSWIKTEDAPILTRIATWIQQCPDARLCYGSILNNARRGEIALALPHVSMEGWVWGVATDAGLIATEINAVDFRYTALNAGIAVEKGQSISRVRSYALRPKIPSSMV